MSASRQSQLSSFARTCPSAVVLTAIGILALLATRPAVAGAEGVAAAAGGDKTALSRLARGENTDSPFWWLARAEEQAGLWGNPFQQAYSFSEIAEVLADGDQIESALAVAGRIKHGPARLSARWRIAAAYARAGKLDAAAALARLGSEPDGRVGPDAYVELNCHVAVALANVGRIEEAEKIATTLGRRPEKWTGEWEPPGNLVDAKARIHAACAAACAKAGRPEAYRKQIEKCKALAKSIPGDINKMWAAMLSSSGVPTNGKGKVEPNPINAIYKTRAIRSAVLAQTQAGDFRGAQKTLELIPPGRSRDVTTRILVEALAGSGAVKDARTAADAITTGDHRDRAYLSLLAAYVRAGDLAAAKALGERVRGRDCRAVARMHVALAAGGSGEAADGGAEIYSNAANKELQARIPGAVPAREAPASLRAKTYRTLARIQIGLRDHSEVLEWIRSLPKADSRFYGYLGASEGILSASKPGRR